MIGRTTGPDRRAVVVVGGASGIGAAVAARHRDAGDRVVIWDLVTDPTTGPADGPGQDVVACDIADPGEIDAALASTIEAIGVPDRVAITAGIGHSALLLEVSPEEWDRVLRVNTRGPMLVMRACARAMIDGSVSGSIVATSSVSARLVDRSMGAYCASKAALSMVVQVAAVEWARHGIRVNAVAPGVTRTPMLGRSPVDSGWLAAVQHRTPLQRLGEADDIAETVLALHGMGWVTGQVLECDGGLGRHSPIDSFGETRQPS